jgi:integrase
MANTASIRLHTREARKKLERRDKPYFVELRRGLALGYRRGATGGAWLLREFRGERYVQRRLAAADDDVPSDGIAVLSWQEAQSKALGLDRPTITKPGKYTVAEAAQEYFDTRSATTPHDAHTWRQFIEPKLGDKAIAELTTGDVERWLAQQVPATSDKEQRRRSQATANRRFSVLRAILNSAYRKDSARVPSADAWRRVRAFQKVDRARQRFLSEAEATALLAALAPPLRALATGALYTGCRLGELLELRVANVTDGRVHIVHSKSGAARHVPLTKAGRAFFAEQVEGKKREAAVFEPVNRVEISRQMRAGCAAAGVVPSAVFHDLRRSYGSLLLNSGAATETIQSLLGHADPRMTRRAYAHLLDSTMQQTVEEHLPAFKPKAARNGRK